MPDSKGLIFKKFDLHVHTPASKDYKKEDKHISAEDIVNVAIDKGLAGIAVTDHQTAERVDQFKSVAPSKKLVVFPGVELLVTGGERGVHIIILFDVDKDEKYINQFLNNIGIFKDRGKKTIAADKTVGQVADALEKYDNSAILILAHCHSSKGVTGDIKGETRTMVFEPTRRCLLGAEAKESDFLDSDKKRTHKRVIDCLDGTDINYHKRKLGVYQSSDAHSLAEIGSAYAYFKVDQPITIEDIRQSLIDRDTRIRQPFEFKEFIYSRIGRLKITSGFLADQEFEFHSGLNSILGAKGSGKSLAIEFLRFVLDQQPTNKELRHDHDLKLDKCLKLHGTVEVIYTDESGKSYKVKRTYNPAEGNPIEIEDLQDNTMKDFQIDQVFRVLFLSQNEIIKIAEDKTGTSQREFIDHFFDFHRYQQDIEGLNEQLRQIDMKFADALKAHLLSAELQKRILTYKERISKIGKQITNKIFDQYSKKEKIGQAITNQIGFIDSLRESLLSSNLEYKDLVPPLSGNSETLSDPSIKRASDITKLVIKKINDSYKESISFLDEKRKVIMEEYKTWNSGFISLKAEYDKVVKDAGGTQVTLDQERKKLNNELSKCEKELAKYYGKSQQIKVIATRRNEIIEKLDNEYREYFEQRKNRCTYFSEKSQGILNVSIKEKKDSSKFKENLLGFRRGSWLRSDDIDIISNCIHPKKFIDNLLRYEWSGRKSKDTLLEISKKTGIKIENIEKLAQHLLDEHEYAEILALYYTSIPKDIPSISYKVGATFKELKDLSVGQKACALLVIALSEGMFPIVIDQPEDSLDLRTIWDDLCQKLRDSKEKRQFIFTTHNSSVAVASDTDKFTILQADADHGKILYTGSMNRRDIKKEVIDYLEGGPETYIQKRRKYNLEIQK